MFALCKNMNVMYDRPKVCWRISSRLIQASGNAEIEVVSVYDKLQFYPISLLGTGLD